MGCTQCGDCCDKLPMRMVVAVNLARDRIDRRDYEWGRDLIERPDGHYWCPRFDAESRTCGDYENRPPVCSDYPWYGRAPSFEAIENMPRCGYIVDVPVAIGG